MKWFVFFICAPVMCFPGGSNGKESACNAWDLSLSPGLGRSPGGGHGNPLQYSCLENPHTKRNLVGYSMWDSKELDMTEQISTAQWQIILNIFLQVFGYLYIAWCSCSVIQLCPTLWDSMDCSTPGLPVHHQHLELAQTHVNWVSDVIQPSHPLLSPSPSAFNLSQHQGLFKWVITSHQVAKVVELQLQHQSFQWLFRTAFL